MSADFNKDWFKMLNSIEAKNMPWGITGGNEWISYKQDDENDYFVQIFMHGSFAEYKRQKDAVVDFFAVRNSKLCNEQQIKENAFGYWRELTFIDCKKIELQKKLAEEHTSIHPSIGSIYAPGGVVNFGNISGSPITIDNSISEIERMIDEHGGEDKEDLRAVLEEVKDMVNEYVAVKQITPKPGLGARLNSHLVKHGWFYGAILQLLGTAAITIIG